MEYPKETGCWCHKCNKDVKVNGWLPYNMSLMILCPNCGCKRCPHASDHMLECTNSNEYGQKGSVYGGLDNSSRVFNLSLDGIPTVTHSIWEDIKKSARTYTPGKVYPQILDDDDDGK